MELFTLGGRMAQLSVEDIQSLNHSTDVMFSKIVKEINHNLTAGLRYEKILDAIFNSLNLVIPYDRIGIALLESKDEIARLVWVRSKGPLSSLVQNYSASLKGSSLQMILKYGEPRVLNDLRLYSAAHPESESARMAIKDGIAASLTCPLKANGKPIGFVFFSSFQPNTYEDKHVDTFLTIADELSIVVEYGRLSDYFSKADSRERSLARVIHDLRAPISTIKTVLNFASGEEWFKELPANAVELYTMLDKTSQEMLWLLEELMELKSVRDSGSADLQSIHLREFLADIINTGEILSREKEIKFFSSLAPALPLDVQLDSLKVKRVLSNLISNAIKFSKRGTAIKFEVTEEDARLVFSVSDQGQGIRQEDIPLLFKEFGRTSTRPTEGESSTGLGLAIASEIVAKLGGRITVESEYGRGSTFKFWIPLTTADLLH